MFTVEGPWKKVIDFSEECDHSEEEISQTTKAEFGFDLAYF